VHCLRIAFVTAAVGQQYSYMLFRWYGECWDVEDLSGFCLGLFDWCRAGADTPGSFSTDKTFVGKR